MNKVSKKLIEKETKKVEAKHNERVKMAGDSLT